MLDRGPAIRSRELGDGLRGAMQQAGLNGKQAAHLLGWSPSWVSRLLAAPPSWTSPRSSTCAGSRARTAIGCSRSARSNTPPAGSSSTAPACPNSS